MGTRFRVFVVPSLVAFLIGLVLGCEEAPRPLPKPSELSVEAALAAAKFKAIAEGKYKVKRTKRSHH